MRAAPLLVTPALRQARDCLQSRCCEPWQPGSSHKLGPCRPIDAFGNSLCEPGLAGLADATPLAGMTIIGFAPFDGSI